MIGTIQIKRSAAFPDMALPVLYAFVGSPSSVRVLDAPRKIGEWRLTDVYLTVSYPDNSVVTKKAVLTGGAWVATVEGSDLPGKSVNGYCVTADGVDENGEPVSGYVLGRGDVVILDRDGAITAEGTTYYLHWLDERPEQPERGDMYELSGQAMLYTGEKWLDLGSDFDPSMYYTRNEVDAKLSSIDLSEYAKLSDLPTKVSQLSNDEGYAKKTEVDASLSAFYVKSETSSAAEISDALANVSVDLSEYYKKAQTSSATEISAALDGKQPSGDYVEQGGDAHVNRLSAREFSTYTDGASEYASIDASQIRFFVKGGCGCADSWDYEGGYYKDRFENGGETFRFAGCESPDFVARRKDLSAQVGNLSAVYFPLSGVVSGDVRFDKAQIWFGDKYAQYMPECFSMVVSAEKSGGDEWSFTDRLRFKSFGSGGWLAGNVVGDVVLDVGSGSKTIAFQEDVYAKNEVYAKSETSSAAQLSAALADVSVDLSEYYTKAQTSSAAEISDAIANVSVDLNEYYKKVETSSAAQLSAAFANVSVDLSEYYTKSETSSAAEISDAFANVSVDLSEYYTKAETSSAAEISAALADAGGGSGVYIDGNKAELSIRVMDVAGYAAVLKDGAELSNELYIVSDGFKSAFGQRIKDVADPSEELDAVNLRTLGSHVADSVSALQSQITDVSAAVNGAVPVLSSAIDSKVLIDDMPKQNINVKHISMKEYAKLLYTGVQLSNCLYVVSGDANFAYGKRIEGVADPSEAQDAATKSYVDAKFQVLFDMLSAAVSSVYEYSQEEIGG